MILMELTGSGKHSKIGEGLVGKRKGMKGSGKETKEGRRGGYNYSILHTCITLS